MPVIDSDYYENFTHPFSVNCEFNFMCISELDVIEHFQKNVQVFNICSQLN